MDLWKSSFLGPFYGPLIRIKYSRATLISRSIPGFFPYCIARRRYPDEMNININTTMGFGAVISRAILTHNFLDSNGIQGNVKAVNPLYSINNEDILSKYFIRNSIQREKYLSPRANEFFLRTVCPEHIPLRNAYALMAKYFSPTDEILRIANSVAEGCENFDLSVHFRSTDKFLESGKIDIATLFRQVERALDGLTRAKIFLASDDYAFQESFRAKFPNLMITSYDNGFVEPGIPRHFSSLNASDKSLEAVINIILLARAPICIRTSSFLSSISALMNPDMKTITINKTISRNRPFPELEILQLESSRY